MNDTPRPTSARDSDSDEPAEPEREDDESADDETALFPAPFAPDKNDDSPLGDTDQHSDA